MKYRVVGFLLCGAAIGACGLPGTEGSSSAEPHVLDPRGFGPIHVGDSFAHAKSTTSFELKPDAGIFRPCQTFDAPAERVYGLMQSDVIRVVGTRSALVATDKGLRVGMTLDDAKMRYGDPYRFTAAPYDPSGSDVLWRVGSLDGDSVWLRAIVHKQEISILEVGQQPEIQFAESCA